MEDFEKAIQTRNLAKQMNIINMFGGEDIDPEFLKGHPVGYINKYGKQKQGDGTWKYVGKDKTPKAESEAPKPTTQVINRTTGLQASSHLHTFSEELQPKVSAYVESMAKNAESSVLRDRINGALTDTKNSDKYSRTLTVRYLNRLFTLYSYHGVWRIGGGGTEGTHPELVREIIPKLEKEINAVAGSSEKKVKNRQA